MFTHIARHGHVMGKRWEHKRRLRNIGQQITDLKPDKIITHMVLNESFDDDAGMKLTVMA